MNSNAKSIFKKVTHCIFDLDGLLLDTEDRYTIALQKVLDQYGKKFDWSVKVQVMGSTGAEMSAKLVEMFDLPITAEEFYALAAEQYKIVMPESQLLPDSERIYKHVYTVVCGSYGKTYTQQLLMKITGRTEKDGANVLIEELQIPSTTDEFLARYHHEANKYLGDAHLMPGAERLVRHFSTNNIPIAVATSSNRDSFELKTTKHKDFFSLFHHITCAGSDPEVKQGKPSPDVFLVCASRFPDKPLTEKCLVFEDAPNGVLAAKAAGMQVVMVPDKQTDEEMCKPATLKLNSLEEVQPELFGLPSL